MTTRKQFAGILKGLLILYPKFNKGLSDKEWQAMSEGYYRILGDLPPELLNAAVLEIGRENTFFPSAAELRKAAMSLVERAEGIPSAQDAWAEVCRGKKAELIAPVKWRMTENHHEIDTPEEAENNTELIEYWQECLNGDEARIERCGFIEPEWSHSLIGQAVRGIGGYAALCASENPTADRARFIEAYNSYLCRSRDEKAMLPEVRRMINLMTGNSRGLIGEGEKPF